MSHINQASFSERKEQIEHQYHRMMRRNKIILSIVVIVFITAAIGGTIWLYLSGQSLLHAFLFSLLGSCVFALFSGMAFLFQAIDDCTLEGQYNFYNRQNRP